MRALLGGAVLLAGCVLSPEEYVERLAHADCVKFRECFADSFETQWDDVGECADQNAAQLDLAWDMNGFYADCAFDVAAARDCLHLRRTRECETTERCDDVWICP